jgi:hypothetical protein
MVPILFEGCGDGKKVLPVSTLSTTQSVLSLEHKIVWIVRDVLNSQDSTAGPGLNAI